MHRENFFIKTLLMFCSFLLGATLVYFFHILQSGIVQRCYITTTVLFAAWVGAKIGDSRTATFWKCLSVWVIYSNIFFDMHTHWNGYPRVFRHLLLCAMPWFVIYSKLKYSVYQLYFWVIIIGIPDISSNVYGNAIMSEIKIFICCIMIIVRFRKKSLDEVLFIENYVWIFFIHDSLVWLACLQIISDWKTKRKKEILPVDSVPSPAVPVKEKRIINESDFNILHSRH